MFDNKTIEELAEKLSKVLPTGFGALQEDIKKNFRAILTETFKKLDLVTREEFEVQTEVLLRTREKLETIEKTIATLEKNLPTAKVHPANKSHKEK